MILYEGPSLIDREPIVVIATAPKSTNAKTGAMLQTYILRSDIDPRDASKSGGDYSICGDCPHRGDTTTDPARKIAVNRRCYVNLGQGPTIVWKAYQRGAYEHASGHDAIAAVGAGRLVRLGTYGDPAAVPSYIWESLLADAKAHTAYTHQAMMPGASFQPGYMMVSADTESEARRAWEYGMRTFRVIQSTADVIPGREIICPASKEAGARTQCADCRLCGGSAVKAKSIAIVDHGPLRKRKAA